MHPHGIPYAKYPNGPSPWLGLWCLRRQSLHTLSSQLGQAARMQPSPPAEASSASAALRHALDGAASDLLRLPAQDFAPRGLVLVVGCVGVLLGLADEPPSWEDCQKMLRGHALRRKPGAIPLRRPTRSERNGQAGAVPASSFWQLLERFDVASVSAAQRQAVLAAIKDDFGGLLQPAHLGQVSRGAAALGRWLQVVQGLLQTPAAAASCMGDVVAISSAGSMSARDDASTPAPMATLFTTTVLERCPECGVRLEQSAVGDHLTLCRARAVERRMAATAAAAEHAALAASAGYGMCGGGGWRGGGCGVGGGVGGGGVGGTVAAGSAAAAAMGLITAREQALITALAAERVHRLAVPPPMPSVEWVRPVSPRLTKPSSYDTPPAPITAPAPLAYAPTEERPPVVEPAPPPAADSALPPEPGYEYLKARSGWAGTGWSAPFPPSARPLLLLDEAGGDTHPQLLAARLRPSSGRLRPSSGRRSARHFVPISGEGGASAGAGTGAGAGAGLAMLARHALAARQPSTSAVKSAAATRPETPQRPHRDPTGAAPSAAAAGGGGGGGAAASALPAGFARAVGTKQPPEPRSQSVNK